jgi:hypothetical protein
MRGFALKAAATALTLVVAAAAAGYVGGHVKNGSAPMQPSVLGSDPSADGGRLTLSPSVRSGDVQAVSTTHSS